MVSVSHSVQELPRLLELVLPVSDHQLVHVPGGVPGGVHLVGRMKRGEVDLKLVVVLPVKLHLLKPVTPENLTRQIGSPAQITLFKVKNRIGGVAFSISNGC